MKSAINAAQAATDDAKAMKLRHKEVAMEKTKQYAASLFQKNEQIKSTEKKLQEYQAMWFELVDEVSDAQKTAKIAARVTKKVKDSSQRRLDMVKEWRGKYNDAIAELQQQGEIFEEMLEEKDNFIQELMLVISDKEMKMETMEFDLDSAIEEIHVSIIFNFL